MTGLLMVGSGIKIFRQERDLLILTGGIRDEKSHVSDVTRRLGCNSMQVGSRSRRLGWDDGIEPQKITGCGIACSIFRVCLMPLILSYTSYNLLYVL